MLSSLISKLSQKVENFSIGDLAEIKTTKRKFIVDKIVKSPMNNPEYDVLYSEKGFECRAKAAKKIK